MKKLIILLMAICMVITFTAIAFADIEHPTSIKPLVDVAAEVLAMADTDAAHAVGREAPNTIDNHIITTSGITAMRPTLIEANEVAGNHLNAYMIETALDGTIASCVATSTGKEKVMGATAYPEPLTA